jgi:hypothetical protein
MEMPSSVIKTPDGGYLSVAVEAKMGKSMATMEEVK